MKNSFVLSMGIAFGVASLNTQAETPTPYLQIHSKKHALSTSDPLKSATELVSKKPAEIVPQLSWNAGNVSIDAGTIYSAKGEFLGRCRVNGTRRDNAIPTLTNFVTDGRVKYALKYQAHCWTNKDSQWHKIDFNFQP